MREYLEKDDHFITACEYSTAGTDAAMLYSSLSGDCFNDFWNTEDNAGVKQNGGKRPLAKQLNSISLTTKLVNQIWFFLTT